MRINRPDIIVTWPNNCDYPIWRQFIRDNRFRFNKVIVGFTETNQLPSYTDFVVNSMMTDDITFFNAPTAANGGDWRNLAVNKALQFVESDWIWFTEQDFFVNQSFWYEVANFMEGYDVITIYQGDRMHPCCLLTETETVKKTRMNFGIVPNVSDHFSLFAEDIKSAKVSVATISPVCYNHMNGLSSNFTLLTTGGQPNYQPDEFKEYIAKCLEVEVPLSEDFVKVCSRLFL